VAVNPQQDVAELLGLEAQGTVAVVAAQGLAGVADRLVELPELPPVLPDPVRQEFRVVAYLRHPPFEPGQLPGSLLLGLGRRQVGPALDQAGVLLVQLGIFAVQGGGVVAVPVGVDDVADEVVRQRAERSLLASGLARVALLLVDVAQLGVPAQHVVELVRVITD
jgi:hypothetical protein